MTDLMAERENGFIEGMEKGERKGRKEGRKEGRMEGMRLERAKNQKKMDLFIKRVVKKTGLSQDELLALKP